MTNQLSIKSTNYLIQYYINIAKFELKLKNKILSLSRKDQKYIANVLFNLKRKHLVRNITASIGKNPTTKSIKRAKFITNINFETICFLCLLFDWKLDDIFEPKGKILIIEDEQLELNFNENTVQ